MIWNNIIPSWPFGHSLLTGILVLPVQRWRTGFRTRSDRLRRGDRRLHRPDFSAIRSTEGMPLTGTPPSSADRDRFVGGSISSSIRFPTRQDSSHFTANCFHRSTALRIRRTDEGGPTVVTAAGNGRTYISIPVIG